MINIRPATPVILHSRILAKDDGNLILNIPPLPAGNFVYEISIDGKPLLTGKLEVTKVTRLQRVIVRLKRLWLAYLGSTRHRHEFDEYGECRGCFKIHGDW
jgi:hypothetical protein